MNNFNWIMHDGVAIITTDPGHPDDISKRLAVIEKTPRVRIRDAYHRLEVFEYNDGTPGVRERWPEFLDWCQGQKGDGPEDEESRSWCERVLTAMEHK
jgi:hypothetical protein